VSYLKGLNYLGAALILLSAAGLLFGPALGIPGYWFLLLFAVGMMVIVIADAGIDAAHSPITFLALLGLYTLLAFWDFLIILILLPVIFITMILGPFMIIVAVLSGLMLGIYVVEAFFHFDISGISGLETAWQAFIALIVFAVSALILWWHFSRDNGEDWLIDWAGNYAESIRKRLLNSIDSIKSV